MTSPGQDSAGRRWMQGRLAQRPTARTAPKLRTGPALVLALLVLPTVVGGTARDGCADPSAPLSWTYRDRTHRFSLKMFKDFEQVPLKTGEHATICKFRDPTSRGPARAAFDAEVAVVKFHRKGGAGPVAATIWDATVNNLRLQDAGKRAIERAKRAPETITSKDEPGIEGKLWAFQVPLPAGVALHVTLAEYVQGDWAYGIFMHCGSALARSYAKRFRVIAASFKYVDDKSTLVEPSAALDGVDLAPRRRVQIEKTLARGWGVAVSPKKSCVVVYNTKQGRNHHLAKVVAARAEGIREQLFEKHFPPPRPIETASVIRLCGDRREYQAYGGPGGSVGYWSRADQEVVIYDLSKSKKPDDDTLAALQITAFTQYLSLALGSVSPHAWFEYGLADYYGGARPKAEKLVITPFLWRHGTIRKAIARGVRPYAETKDASGLVQKKWGRAGYTPLADFVRFTASEYLAYPTVSYAQGWALIYFLREIVPKNEAYRVRWGRILDTYYETFRGEVAKSDPAQPMDSDRARRKALDAAFEGVAWDALEAAWVTAMKGGR